MKAWVMINGLPGFLWPKRKTNVKLVAVSSMINQQEKEATIKEVQNNEVWRIVSLTGY